MLRSGHRGIQVGNIARKLLTTALQENDADEPVTSVQDDRLGRGQFVSLVAVRRDADEVHDGDAESRDRRWRDSRRLVSSICRPVGQVTDQTSMGQ